ncbi:MAG: hypothetical protein KGN36_07755 [Acidobacteriota bacterium]|nr:hypothetical protein [Acidobacteriota bacterium]
MRLALLALVVSFTAPTFAQHAHVRDAAQVDFPGQTDSNSPSFYLNGQFNQINSIGLGPTLAAGPDQFHLGPAAPVSMTHVNPWPTWIESVWVDPTGVVFAWYHQEHFGVCPGTNFSVPHIGAAISYDGGASFYDMGTIVASGDPIDCSSQNGYFAGGNGDVNVIVDRHNQYFYFFFTNYSGPVENQGVVAARLPFASRWSPIGAVQKYYQGDWTEPGIGGRTTPVFPAKVSWQQPNTNSFWGPSLHWNTYLESYVMLLNHSCCTPGFPQKGIWASYATDLSKPASWTKPQRILTDTGWYPQVIGLGPQGTDRRAGRIARLYIYGHSRWEIVFEKPAPQQAPPQ